MGDSELNITTTFGAPLSDGLEDYTPFAKDLVVGEERFAFMLKVKGKSPQRVHGRAA